MTAWVPVPAGKRRCDCQSLLLSHLQAHTQTIWNTRQVVWEANTWTGRKAGKGRKVEEDIVDAETWAWHVKDTENEVKEVGEDMKGEWKCNQGDEFEA